MRSFLIISFLCCIQLPSFAQIFTESMGTVAGTTPVATHEAANGFDNDTYTMTGTGDVRITTVSSGYAGASGNANIFLTNTVGRDFQIEGINTTGCTLTSITHGMFKSTTTSNGSELICEVSSDGTTYTPLTLSALPTGAGTATWHLRTCTGVIPATANLRIRFRQTSATVQFRVDDVILNGSCTPENCSDGIDNDGDGFIDGADPDCPANTITTGVVAGSPFLITCSTFLSITVPFTSTGTYNAGNVFTAQLSDATGSFSFPIVIGNLSLSGVDPSGNIPATILAGLTTGASYRIRVISSDPAVTGTDNGVNLTITNSGSPCYGPLILNEVSQGPSGSKEYMEFLVIGNNPCGTIDIRNLIFDDNNGDFSGGPVAGTGIANGHIRFTNHAQWANVPNGSLIVVYNEVDLNASLPADDPSDLLVPDRVYVLPSNSSFLEGCSSIPTVGNAAYTPCVYGAGSFAYISMANSADAAQTRFADGTYNHGVSWGAAPMNGGPDGLNIGTTSSSAQLIEFENTIDDDYTNAANFTRSNAPADETPGAPNSAANAAFINTFMCTTLPVELISFDVRNENDKAVLTWSTASETACSHFIVERAGTDLLFEAIGRVSGFGTTSFVSSYNFIDSAPLSGQSYYRLRQFDFDGKFTILPIRAFNLDNTGLSNSYFNGNELILQGCDQTANVKVFSTSGALIMQCSGRERIDFSMIENGYYIINITCGYRSFNLSVSRIR